MLVKRNSGWMTLAALAIIAGPLAQAQDPGWYAGLSVGRATSTLAEPEIKAGLQSGGFTTVDLVDRDHATGFKLQGGYQFNRHFALEGGYFDLGEFGFTASTLPAGTFSGDTRIRGLNLDLVGILPFTARFSALGRLGVTQAEAKNRYSGTGLVVVREPNLRRRATNPKLGIGLQYQFTPVLGIRLEAERYRISDPVAPKGDVDLLSLGVLLRFGQAARPQAAIAAPMPLEPVAQAVPALANPGPRSQVYCSQLELQFEVDEGDIQAADRENLAVLGTFMRKYPETTAVIEGHTDNVGTPEHNLQLSQRRADSVVAYLVETQHVGASRLQAHGYGDARPIADNGTQEGNRQNRRTSAIITCANDLEGLAVKPARATMALVMEFDPNATVVRSEYGQDLARVASFLKTHPKVTAVVEGHTGNLQATPELAMAISRERAENVVTYLVDRCGVSRTRLTAEGYGQTRRYAYNTSAEGQQENRRVNIVFTYPR